MRESRKTALKEERRFISRSLAPNFLIALAKKKEGRFACTKEIVVNEDATGREEEEEI